MCSQFSCLKLNTVRSLLGQLGFNGYGIQMLEAALMMSVFRNPIIYKSIVRISGGQLFYTQLIQTKDTNSKTLTMPYTVEKIALVSEKKISEFIVLATNTRKTL